MDNHLLYLFANTRAVVNAQKAIMAAQLKCLIVPVPRHLSSECGMSIETAGENESRIDDILNRLKIPFSKSSR